MEHQADEKLLTIDQLAEKMQVTRETIRKWRKAGTVKEYKVGSTVRFKLSEIINHKPPVSN